MNNFGSTGHQDLFTTTMDISSYHNWTAAAVAPAVSVAAVAGGGWGNQAQSLSLSLYNNHPQPNFQIKSCKFLLPAQDLVNEFCSLGEGNCAIRRNNNNIIHDSNSSNWIQQSFYSLEPLELQRRKSKLLSMLEEVDRRYRRYCEQMKAVVSTFEEIAGKGAARTYSQLASNAMSRHFRCLRDGIAAQIKATRRAMGENEAAVTATRGDTPRLKLLDQCLRQHKAFQQAGVMESHPWRPQRGLPDRSVSILRAWLFEHFLHPYPSDVDKHILSRQTGLSRSQVSNWFINARVRLWKPMIEEMYKEELKEEDKNSNSSHATTTMQESGNIIINTTSSPSFQPTFEEKKPSKTSFVHLQLDEQNSLSSIINNIHNANNNHHNFGIIETDFGSYRGHELTLGLQQHEEDDEVQFSILEGETQNIPYRNLMGAQLLHDLAG